MAAPTTTNLRRSSIRLRHQPVGQGSVRQAAAFRKGLHETGYVEGQSAMVEYHWLEGQYDRLPARRAIGRQILFVKAADERDFAAGFGTIVQAGAGGLLLGSGAFLFSRRRQLATMAARHALPAIGVTRNFAEAGSLMSYGASFYSSTLSYTRK
jgi:hypothetical protein